MIFDVIPAAYDVLWSKQQLKKSAQVVFNLLAGSGC